MQKIKRVRLENETAGSWRRYVQAPVWPLCAVGQSSITSALRETPSVQSCQGAVSGSVSQEVTQDNNLFHYFHY